MAKLGVNVDHVATLRQARGEHEPDPLEAVVLCEKAGADSIVCHLREDRRHIIDRDVRRIRDIVQTHMNLEMSLNKDIVKIAARIKPDEATLVPERRQEVTTEGGLDVVKYFTKIRSVNDTLMSRGIQVSLFIDPVKKQIQKVYESGAPIIELHTGCYARAKTKASIARELKKLKTMTQFARSLGLIVNAGHGLKYHNTKAVARIPGIEELNIGHSIMARAIFVGLPKAVKEMRQLCRIS